MKKLFPFLLSILPLTAMADDLIQDGEITYDTYENNQEYGLSEESSPRFFLYGDFLYWKASVSDMPYAVTGLFEVSPTLNVAYINDDQIRQVKFSHDPGFRVGAGYGFDCGWDVRGDWLRFHTKSKTSSNTGEDPSAFIPGTSTPIINQIWLTYAGLNASASSISAQSTSKFDQVVVNLNKRMGLGTAFYLDLSFGALGAWLKNEMIIETDVVFVPAALTGAVSTELKNHFSGGGVQLGLGSEYSFWRYLSIYGRGFFSLLYGEFKLSQNDLANLDAGGVTETLPHNGSANEHDVVCSWDFLIGVKSTYQFGNWFELSGHVGYEMVYWPNQIRLRRALNQSPLSFLLMGHGDVGFQGLNTGLSLQF